MRPLPIPSHAIRDLNAQSAENERIIWKRLTMNPPEGAPNVDPIEVAVECHEIELDAESRLKVAALRCDGKIGPDDVPLRPVSFLSRWAVQSRDLEAIRRGGVVWLRIMGDSLPPASVFVTSESMGVIHDPDAPTILERVEELEAFVREVAILDGRGGEDEAREMADLRRRARDLADDASATRRESDAADRSSTE